MGQVFWQGGHYIPVTNNSDSNTKALTKVMLTSLDCAIQSGTYNEWSSPINGELKISVPTSIAECIILFVAGTNVSVTLPSTIKWEASTSNSYTEGNTYIISIINNLAVKGEF